MEVKISFKSYTHIYRRTIDIIYITRCIGQIGGTVAQSVDGDVFVVQVVGVAVGGIF